MAQYPHLVRISRKSVDPNATSMVDFLVQPLLIIPRFAGCVREGREKLGEPFLPSSSFSCQPNQKFHFHLSRLLIPFQYSDEKTFSNPREPSLISRDGEVSCRFRETLVNSHFGLVGKYKWPRIKSGREFHRTYITFLRLCSFPLIYPRRRRRAAIIKLLPLG